MKKIVKIFVTGLIVSLLMMKSNIYAEEIDIEEYVTNFVNEISEDYEVYISDIQCVYDEKGKCGYYYLLETEGVSCGYVLYSEEIGDIEEFCVDYGKESFCNEKEKEDILFRESALEYDIIKKGNRCSLKEIKYEDIYQIEKKNKNFDDINYLGATISQYDYLDDMIMNSPDVASNSNFSLSKYNYLKKRYMYTSSHIESWGLEEFIGCVPIAMLNVCAQCSFVDTSSLSKLKQMYGVLYSVAGTDKYGNTADNVIGDTIQRIAKAMCSIDITYNFKRNPSVSFFTKAVDKNYPSILGLVGKGLTGEGEYCKVGHAVSVNGYIKYINKNTGAVKTYLQVADGWYCSTRCILYDSINAESTSGTIINYKTR